MRIFFIATSSLICLFIFSGCSVNSGSCNLGDEEYICKNGFSVDKNASSITCYYEKGFFGRLKDNILDAKSTANEAKDAINSLTE